MPSVNRTGWTCVVLNVFTVSQNLVQQQVITRDVWTIFATGSSNRLEFSHTLYQLIDHRRMAAIGRGSTEYQHEAGPGSQVALQAQALGRGIWGTHEVGCAVDGRAGVPYRRCVRKRPTDDSVARAVAQSHTGTDTRATSRADDGFADRRHYRAERQQVVGRHGHDS